jgi:hypothetical protein
VCEAVERVAQRVEEGECAKGGGGIERAMEDASVQEEGAGRDNLCIRLVMSARR